MKTNHKMTVKVSQVLDSMGITGLFTITEQLVVRVTHILDPTLIQRHANKNKNSSSYKKALEHSYQITRRDLLKVLWLRNNKSAKGISRDYGYVYAISNPSWPDLLKVGTTVDIPSRLSSYQTYSPYRDYKVEVYKLVKYPYEVEKLILASTNSTNEWIARDELPIFRKIISESSAAW